MKTILPSFVKPALQLTLLQLGLLFCPALRAGVAFTVTPAAVSNTYSGFITLQVTGLSAGDTVVVQKYLDVNGSGVIASNDWLVQQFQLTDGQPGMVIGGIVNSNVPGDTDTTPGQITTPMNFQNGDFMQNIAGQYLFKLSSPAGHFTAKTNLFSITNVPFAQKLTGNVLISGTSTPVPNAIVLLERENGPAQGGVLADNSGSYTIPAPPGTYTLLPFKSNYVFNQSSSALPVLALSSGQTITTNLTVTAATASISGQLVDSNNLSIGLPGVFLGATASNSLTGIGLTDSNGNFTVGVVSNLGNWSFKLKGERLIVHGYVGLNEKVSAAAGQTDVTLAVPKGTAMFYGSVKDNLGSPMPGIEVESSDKNNNYQGDGYTDANGNYAAVALGGLGNDSWQVGLSSDTSPAGYLFSQPLVDSNGGTNMSTGQALPANFTALLATNSISGSLKDNNGNPIPGIGVYGNDLSDTNYQAYVDTDTNGNYSLSVGNGTWKVGINSCNGCGGDSLPGNYLPPPNQTFTISNDNATADFIAQLCGTIIITTTSLPAGEINEYYDQFGQASSCSSTFTWSIISGSLPPGLSGNPFTGEISGTPTNSGVYPFIIQVVDGNGLAAIQALTLTVNGGPLSVTTASLTSGTTNVPYNSQQLTASGGQPPYRWSLASGGLPSGLGLSTNGVISGTPTRAGTTNFVVKVTDSASATATQPLSLAVYALSTSVTFSVSTGAVSNSYSGLITLQVAGLNIGETVQVEKFLDVNGDGAVDAGDSLMRSFPLTDGQASVIGGVTNVNVPGDTTPADGSITAQLSIANDVAQEIVGQYIFRLTSPTGRFAPMTALFDVTNAAYAQSFSGSVQCGGVNVPYATVLVVPANSTSRTPVAGVLANSAGNYSIKLPPGPYSFYVFKSNYVANLAQSPTLTLSNGADVTTNLTFLVPATQTISGRFVDAAYPGVGLPAIYVICQSTNSLMAGACLTDTNGNFTMPVTPSQWGVSLDESGLTASGYLVPQSSTTVQTASGSVSNVSVTVAKGTALFYGSVKDSFGNPLPSIEVESRDNNNLYGGDAYTDTNGNYVVVALGGLSFDPWQVEISSDHSPADYLYQGPGFDSNGGANLGSGQALPGDFSALLATNTISGYLKDNTGKPIAGVGVYAYATISEVYYQLEAVDTGANGYYSLDVASGSWSVGLIGSGYNDSLPTNYLSPQYQTVVISSDNGTANFTAPVATQVITGFVQDSHGNPVTGVGVYANDVSDTNYGAYADTDGNGNYSLNVIAGSWSVGVNCSGGNDSLDNILGRGNYECPTNENVTITNETGTANFTVEPPVPLQITTTNLPAGSVGIFYEFQLQATGGHPPYQWGWTTPDGNPPPGLNLTFSNGVLYGYPSASGTFVFSVQAYDNYTSQDSTNQWISVYIAPSAPPLQVTTTSLPNATNGVYYSQQLQCSGGVAPYYWTNSPGSASLPPNLTLGTNGVISGMPAGSGTFYFFVRAIDSTSATADQLLSLTINIAPLQVTTVSLPNGTNGVYYSQQLQCSGGVAPYYWTNSPGSASLPPNLTLATNGIISGTPTGSGTYYFYVRAIDSTAATADHLLSLTITNKPVITLTGATRLTNGEFQFKFNTSAGATYAIQSSSNLLNWSLLLDLSGSGVPLTVMDPGATTNRRQFYRVEVLPP